MFKMPTEEQIIEVLKQVNDPELNIDVHTLGLIYDVKVIDEKSVYVKMTFTTPTCPYGPMLVQEVKQKIEDELKSEAEVEITFDPVWKPSEELRALLGV